jgi:hypothetical protein
MIDTIEFLLGIVIFGLYWCGIAAIIWMIMDFSAAAISKLIPAEDEEQHDQEEL